MAAGYVEEATRWRDWVIRAVAGDPEDLQIMYGVAGERRLDEYELDWLPGYEGSAPVRVGQRRLGTAAARRVRRAHRRDLPGPAARHGAASRGAGPRRGLIRWLEEHWRDPDDGIWEVRGRRRQFVHSKVMAWVAADRLVKMAEESGFEAPARRAARRMRDEIHEEVCREGLRRRAEHVHAVLRVDAARRRAAADPAGRVPARRPTPGSWARSTRSSESSCATAS